jgi:hypothetical protein
MRPLKLSQKPFCIGFPGAMKCQTTLLACAQANMAFEVNSVPSSETIMPGYAPFDQRRQFPRHAPARDQGVRDRRQALPRHVIDDVQDAEPPAAGKLVMDEIHRPASVRLGFDQDRRPRPHGAPPSPSLAHRQAFFAIKPVDAVDARGSALLPQQDEQPTISKTLPLVGEIARLRPKLPGRRPACAITNPLAVSADDRAGPPFRQPIVARRCATPSRLTAGPTIFLTEAREAQRHPTSARPKLLQFGVLVLELLQPFGFRDVHPAVLGLQL